MVPVKFYCFATYYKQKTGRVIMKNIFRLFILFFCFDTAAYAANNNIFSGMPGYLVDTAHAWAGIYSEFGPGAQIATYINEARTNDIARYLDTISILGFNNTAMALFEVSSHIDRAFDVIDTPLVARRGSCTANLATCEYGRRTLVVDGHRSGTFSEYRAGQNGDFKTKNTGFTINAKSYFADGWLFGVEYTRTMTDTHDTRIYSDATGNSVTMFTQYLARSGLFWNVGINAGHTSWNIDKSIAGISDDGTYDTNFYAGQTNFGIRMQRNRISVTPSVAVRYLRISADEYIDAVAQQFDQWWYNSLTASVGLDLGFDFVGSDFVVRPSLHLGGRYDVISNGTDEMRVQLIDNQFYYVPIDTPHRAALDAGIGLDFFNQYFTAGLTYGFDMRSDYMSHTIMAKLKIAF